MINRISGVVIIILLLVGAFMLYSQDSRETMKKETVRLVTDGAGRQVSIPAHPKKVVALNASSIDLYVSAGGSLAGRAATETLPPDVKAAVQQVPTVGLTPNPDLEKIVAMKPDLVLAANIPYHHALVPVLEKAGIPILLQTMDNYQQILDTLRFYGELTGQTDKAASQIAQIEKQYQTAVQNTAGKPAPKVLVLWGTTESFSMALSSSFTGDLVKRLGGINVSDQADKNGAMAGYVPLSLEFVAKASPEVILFITHSSDDKVEEKFKNELAGHPAWQGSLAVRQNRVHKLPYQLFAVNPGTQVGKAMEVLSGLLYSSEAK